MREVFDGWRRKAGVVTLGMALPLMGMWIRSDSVGDFIIWPAANSREEMLISAESKLTWQTAYDSEEVAGYPRWVANVLDKSVTVIEADKQYTVYRFRFLGIEAGDVNFPHGPGGIFSFCCIPYGFIVIPLTLLSAWLILSKPRNKQKSSVQLTNSNGNSKRLTT